MPPTPARFAVLKRQENVSDDYYLVHVETLYLLRWGIREHKPVEVLKRERRRCIHKVSGAKAAEVAAAVCDILNDELRGRDYGPVFKAVSAGVLKLSQAAGFDERVRALDGALGDTDSDNPDKRDAAYHDKALALEAAVRQRMGLTGSTATTQRKPKQSGRGRKPDTDFKEDAKIAAAWGTGIHGDHEELARAMGKTREEVKRALDRHRKRPT